MSLQSFDKETKQASQIGLNKKLYVHKEYYLTYLSLS